MSMVTTRALRQERRTPDLAPGQRTTVTCGLFNHACSPYHQSFDLSCIHVVQIYLLPAMLFYSYLVWSDLWFLDGHGYLIYLSFLD